MSTEPENPEEARPDPQRPGTVEYRGTGFYVSLVVILIVAVVLLILSVLNTQTVTLSLPGFDIEMPLFAVVIGAGIIAVVLDELVGLVWRARRRRRLSERAELARLRSERPAEVPDRSEVVGPEADHTAGFEPGEAKPEVWPGG